jgi:hypothetical protein
MLKKLELEHLPKDTAVWALFACTLAKMFMIKIAEHLRGQVEQPGVKNPHPLLCLFFQCFPAVFAECERQAKLSVGELDQRPITSARMKSAAPPIDQPNISMEQRQEAGSKTIGKYKKGLETCYEQRDVELRHVQRQGREKRE